MWLGCIWCCAMPNDGYDLSRSCSNAQGIRIPLHFLLLQSAHHIWMNILIDKMAAVPLFLMDCLPCLLFCFCRSILMQRQNMIWSKTIRFYRRYSTSWKLRRYFNHTMALFALECPLFMYRYFFSFSFTSWLVSTLLGLPEKSKRSGCKTDVIG